MAGPSLADIEILSGDLVPFISDGESSVVLVIVVEADWSEQQERDLELHVGDLSARVLEVFESDVLKPDQSITIPFRRVADRAARARSGFDQWNNLPLERGDHLLLACRPGGAPSIWIGFAATLVESRADPDVAALRQCYGIERVIEDPDRIEGPLQDSLVGSRSLQRRYALDALGRRAVLGRETGTRLVSDAVRSGRVDPEIRLELGSALTGGEFFQQTRRTDRANQLVIAALASQLVDARTATDQVQWAQLLGACLLGEFSEDVVEDRSARLSLVRLVDDPPATSVLQALTTLSGQVGPDERDVVLRLRDLWRDVQEERA